MIHKRGTVSSVVGSTRIRLEWSAPSWRRTIYSYNALLTDQKISSLFLEIPGNARREFWGSAIPGNCLEFPNGISGGLAPLYGNITSFTKPEVHSVSRIAVRYTPSHRQLGICLHNIWWNLDVRFFEIVICKQADRQTDKQTNKETDKTRRSQYFAPLTIEGEVAESFVYLQNHWNH